MRARRTGVWASVLATAIGLVATVVLGCGCQREAEPVDWWMLVTGVEGDSLGFEDRWESQGAGPSGLWLAAHVRSGDLARLDASPSAGSYSVVYNHGRTVQVHPEPATEMPVDRTLFLTYLLPFMGAERLGAVLTEAGIDTSRITRDVNWDGRTCIVVGGGERDTLGNPEWRRSVAGRAGVPEPARALPAIYFDQASGAVLRLITVAQTPIGPRVGDFRLRGHQPRRGARLPTVFETYGAKGLRNRLVRTTTRDTALQGVGMFAIPPGVMTSGESAPPGAAARRMRDEAR